MLQKIKNHIAIILELGKVRITFFVAFSTSAGYLFFSGNINMKMIFTAAGVFLLACGSSALNHFQERNSDALMERTKNRPIPSGRISAFNSVLISSILSISGLTIIYFSSNTTAVILGCIAFVWYNLIYTPLKKRFALAVIPGSVIGAIPPMIGWVAAGGYVFDLTIIALAFFFFIWQIPHFWLLLLLHSKDYERAGFPVLTKLFNKEQLGRITFVWIAAMVVSCMLIPFYNISLSNYSMLAMFFIGVWILFDTRQIVNNCIERLIFRKTFLKINLYVLTVVLIISIDKLF